MGGSLAESRGRVVSKPAVIFTEVAKREAVEVPAVGWIAERTEISVVRRDDDRAAAGSKQAIELFHGADHVGHVLNDVDRAHFAERTVAEWKGEMIEIGDHIRLGGRIAIQTY